MSQCIEPSKVEEAAPSKRAKLEKQLKGAEEVPREENKREKIDPRSAQNIDGQEGCEAQYRDYKRPAAEPIEENLYTKFCKDQNIHGDDRILFDHCLNPFNQAVPDTLIEQLRLEDLSIPELIELMKLNVIYLDNVLESVMVENDKLQAKLVEAEIQASKALSKVARLEQQLSKAIEQEELPKAKLAFWDLANEEINRKLTAQEERHKEQLEQGIIQAAKDAVWKYKRSPEFFQAIGDIFEPVLRRGLHLLWIR